MSGRVLIVPTMTAGGAVQMALDDELLDEAETATARRYLWAPPTVSLGKFQKLHGAVRVWPDEQEERGECDEGADRHEEPTPSAHAEVEPLAIVRRPSGGRAVLHGAGFEWSFALVLLRADLQSDSLQASYRFVNGAFSRALSDLGVPLDDARETPYQRSGLCFATALRHDLSVAGGKVVAIAQARRGERVLVHGSVLERRPPQALTAQVERLVGEPWQGEGLAAAGVALDGEEVFARFIAYVEAVLPHGAGG
jgi:lipoate-protein ligase A